MAQQYNTETKKILQNWIYSLKQNDVLDGAFVSQLQTLIDSAEVGDAEKIQELLEELEQHP